MSATILISTGARLHFGFFAHDGARSFSGETNYGGVGLMIDSPSFVLAASGHDPESRAHPSGTPGQLKIESGLDEVRCNMKRATQAAQAIRSPVRPSISGASWEPGRCGSSANIARGPRAEIGRRCTAKWSYGRPSPRTMAWGAARS